jgi:hypothetical protein
MSWNDDQQKLLGRKVVGVARAVVLDKYDDERDSVELQFDNGDTASVYLTGDCCSRSHFTDPKQFDELVGATIQAVEHRDGPVTGEEDREVQKWHFLVFVTDRGHVTLDWRNDSNGYYDGDVTVRYEVATP